MALIVTNIKSLGAARQPRSDLDIGKLILRGEKKLSANLRSSISSGQLEQTIEGASTLTLEVRDTERGLLRSDLVKTRSMMQFDDLWYSLVKVARQGNALTLTFEETAVSLLRRYNKPKKANRDNTTRAAFIKSMVTEVTESTIPFRCPELNERQSLAKAA